MRARAVVGAKQWNLVSVEYPLITFFVVAVLTAGTAGLMGLSGVAAHMLALTLSIGAAMVVRWFGTRRVRPSEEVQ